MKTAGASFQSYFADGRGRGHCSGGAGFEADRQVTAGVRATGSTITVSPDDPVIYLESELFANTLVDERNCDEARLAAKTSATERVQVATVALDSASMPISRSTAAPKPTRLRANRRRRGKGERSGRTARWTTPPSPRTTSVLGTAPRRAAFGRATTSITRSSSDEMPGAHTACKLPVCLAL